MPMIDWPPWSPGLNPIENIWNILKNKLDKRHPHPAGRQGMVEAIMGEWENIMEAELLPLVDSMPEGVPAVVLANGSYTRW